MRVNVNRVALALASAGILTIYGCGGGGGSSPAASSLSISGTAASGAAIAGGTVDVKCATGTGTATTNADGTYTVSISNGAAPCMLRVTSGSTVLFSALESGATSANISPLTQLVVANALGSDPATVFSAGVSSSTNISAATLSTAVTNVQTALAGLGLSLSGVDPLKSTLTAATDTTAGNAQDKQIDGLMAALKNVNVPITALTTVLATPTASTASAATTAVTNFATTNAISTAALSNCPLARNGDYYYAGPGDTTLNHVTMNFSTNTGQDITNSVSFTIAPDPVKACAYTFTLASGKPVNVRVSASGLGAFSINGATAATSTFPNATAVALDGGATSAVGLLIPMQTGYTANDMAGAYYSLQFAKMVSSNTYRNVFAKTVLTATDATHGNVQFFQCWGNGTACSATEMTGTASTFVLDQSTGITTITRTADGTQTQIAAFRSANGDIAGIGVNTAANATLTNNFFMFSKRVSPFVGRTAGSSYSMWGWTLNNGTAGSIMQKSFYRTFTVNSVDTTAKSFTRTSDETPTPTVDTIFLDSPLTGIGMIHRPAVTASSTTLAAVDFIGLTGIGWTIFGPTAMDPTVAQAANTQFFGISIQQQ
jgi:hypothetical protein